MIARHEAHHTEKVDIWSRLAAPLAQDAVSWRQDGKPVLRDGRYFARFVAYVEANTVRERLDSVVPGEWDLTLELLPSLPTVEDGDPATCSFKARLQILGVIREDVGTGRDYKSAATDAFKRAAVRFGVAHELYNYEQNWVEVDSDSRYAKALEEPQAAYNRRYSRLGAVGITPAATLGVAASADAPAAIGGGEPVMLADVAASGPIAVGSALIDDLPSCPKCGGRMWDNRATKRNPKAPDYKCRDRSCDGVIWPPRPGAQPAAAAPAASTPAPAPPTPAQPAPAKRRSKTAAAASGAQTTLDSSPLGSTADDIPF
jgi:Rad52/22 family double-strand break repair protein